MASAVRQSITTAFESLGLASPSPSSSAAAQPQQQQPSVSSQDAIHLEEEYSAHKYAHARPPFSPTRMRPHLATHRPLHPHLFLLRGAQERGQRAMPLEHGASDGSETSGGYQGVCGPARAENLLVELMKRMEARHSLAWPASTIKTSRLHD